MQRSWLTILPFLLLLGCNSQTDKQLSEQVVSLHKQADSSGFESRLAYLQEARYLLANLPAGYDSIRINNFARLGEHYRERGIVDSSAVQYFRAITLITDSIGNEQQTELFYNCWEAFYTLKNYGDCITIADKYLMLSGDDDFNQLAAGYYMKENTFKGLRKYDSAYHYNTLRIQALEKDDNITSVVPALISKAQYLYYDFNDKEGTFAILDSIKNASWELSNNLKRQLFGNYGVYLFREDKKELALESYLMGLKYAKQIPDSPDKNTLLAYPYANIAEVLIDLKEYNDAKAHLDSAMALGFKNIDRSVQSSLLKYKFNLSSQTNDDSSEVVKLLDSVVYALDAQYQDKFQNELSALSEASNTEQQLIQKNTTTQIENLKLQTHLLMFIVAAIILAALGFWFYWYRNLKFERTQIQMQQRLLRTQMNPHYTSNSLYAIDRLLNKSPEQASSLLKKFSRQLRQVMENSLKNKVSLEDEIAALRGYLELQKLRLPNGLEYQIEFENLEEDDPIFIPPMLIQPFVENAIEHGFKGIDYLGEVYLRINQGPKTLHCIIEDNGKGLANGKFKGRANSSTSLIGDFLKKTTKKEVVVTDKSGPNQSGIIVTIEVPYSKKGDF